MSVYFNFLERMMGNFYSQINTLSNGITEVAKQSATMIELIKRDPSNADVAARMSEKFEDFMEEHETGCKSRSVASKDDIIKALQPLEVMKKRTDFVLWLASFITVVALPTLWFLYEKISLLDAAVQALERAPK